MAAIDTSTQELFLIAKCYECYAEGASQAQLLKMALLAQAANQLAPGVNIDPQSLMERGKCYACLGLSDADIMELALLQIVATNINTITVGQSNKFGSGDPNGVVTPDFIGQFYTDTDNDDDLWQAYGAGNNSWSRWI